MQLKLICLVALAVPRIQASMNTNKDGLLEGTTCHLRKDCSIRDGELELDCQGNKCACLNRASARYYLQIIDGKCVMLKYGPCGKNSEAEVGCADGFQGKCLDPQNPSKTSSKTFEFYIGSCDDSCHFSDHLHLNCEGRGLGPGKEKCICAKYLRPYPLAPIWDLRSYEGDKNCSVGQFGPCGEKNGILIECHGEGISCVEGICINPNRPHNALNEPCQELKNCERNLVCSVNRKCIKRQTVPAGESCDKHLECEQGLHCKLDTNRKEFHRWGSTRVCQV